MKRWTVGRPVTTVLRGLIRAYQLVLAPLWPGACRYEPNCSEYALLAVDRFGALKGSCLAGQRILRCHPWGAFGFDPVPDRHNVDARGSAIIPGEPVVPSFERHAP